MSNTNLHSAKRVCTSYDETVTVGDGLTHRAQTFATRYAAAQSERQLAQSFWRDFFTDVLQIPDLLVAGIEFEVPVRGPDASLQFIDCLWPRTVLIEHKTSGRDLAAAEKQARTYLAALPPSKRPGIIVLSDFQRFRIIDIIRNESLDFPLTDLPSNIERFISIIEFDGVEATTPRVDADKKAAELMGELFTAFEEAGYEGHQLSVFLIRILFLNFGDDTGMWKHVPGGLFGSYIENTYEDGTGVGGRLQELFQVLDTPETSRPSSLSTTLQEFPYVNGGLFDEQLPIFSFTASMRDALIATTKYDWSNISPAIFGSMFQVVKDRNLRRESGEFYTNEADILRVISPLFLDDLTSRLDKAWTSKPDLRALWKDLGKANYLDPSAGSGNFLLVAYKKLRQLELKLIARLNELEGRSTDIQLDGSMGLQVHLKQFHGIEVDEWSSQIAYVAMFLADQQANQEMEKILGVAPNRFPLVDSAVIQQGSALRMDWSQICPMNKDTIIMGNPPFNGSRLMTEEQKQETRDLWGNIKGSGELDYVANWFLIAARLASTKNVRVGFVATNSIAQGEQPAILWSQLSTYGVHIDFAYTTFDWDTNVGIHAVIIGLSTRPRPKKVPLWQFTKYKGDPELNWAENINAYLTDAPDVLITTRSTPLSPATPKLVFGSMPNDGGFLSSINPEEAAQIQQTDPIASQYLHRLVGAKELTQNKLRYCLWLLHAEPSDLRSSPTLSQRIEEVRQYRLASKRSATQRLAETPWLFGEIRHPDREYIVVPRHTTENRDYIPMGFFPPEVITNDSVLIIPEASRALFAVLMSRPFNIWTLAVSGKLRIHPRISATITYNNFPFPELTADTDRSLSDITEAILTARSNHPNSSLSDLYDPRTMPHDLRTAHKKADKEVLKVMNMSTTAKDDKILAELFVRYATHTQEPFPT